MSYTIKKQLSKRHYGQFKVANTSTNFLDYKNIFFVIYSRYVSLYNLTLTKNFIKKKLKESKIPAGKVLTFHLRTS